MVINTQQGLKHTDRPQRLTRGKGKRKGSVRYLRGTAES